MTMWDSLPTATGSAEAIRTALDLGDIESADRLVTELISRVILAPRSVRIPEEAIRQPRSTGSARYDTLLATGLAFALNGRGEKQHDWMLLPPALASEWLWDGDDAASAAFRDFIRSKTPPLFLSKNILLREQDLIAP